MKIGVYLNYCTTELMELRETIDGRTGESTQWFWPTDELKRAGQDIKIRNTEERGRHFPSIIVEGTKEELTMFIIRYSDSIAQWQEM